MIVNVHYGIDEVPKNFDRDSISVGEVIANSTVKSALGYGDNVKGLVSGVEVPNSAMLTDGDHLYIEVKANSKAVTNQELQGALADVADAIDKLADLSDRIASAIGR